MPANDHLQFYDITDFTPGVFGETGISADQILVPANGFAKMRCYYPLKQGGVRAFYKTQETVLCTGRTAANTEAATGLFAHGQSGTKDNLLLTTHNSADHKTRVYEWKGNSSATQWCIADTCSAGATDAVGPTDFVFFLDNSNIQYYVYVLRGVGGATGVYSSTYKPDGTVSPTGVTANGYFQKIDTYVGPLGINGARILVGDGTVGSKLRWTDEGALSFSASNFGIFAPNSPGAGMRGIISMQPDSFLVMRGGAPWLQFNGDVGTTGTNREMADEYHGRTAMQQPVRVPSGIAFIEPGGYIYVTDGNTFTNISPQLPAFSPQVHGALGSVTISSPGNLSFINGFLFAPDGKVLHWDTMSWFTIDEDTAFTSQTEDLLYLVNRGNGSAVKCIGMYQGDGDNRSTYGCLQTAPFADKGGRNVEVREVQLYVESYGSGGNICVQLVDGTDTVKVTRQHSLGTGRQIERFLFPNTKSEYLSVRVVVDGASNEAATIERMRIGFGANNDIAGI